MVLVTIRYQRVRSRVARPTEPELRKIEMEHSSEEEIGDGKKNAVATKKQVARDQGTKEERQEERRGFYFCPADFPAATHAGQTHLSRVASSKGQHLPRRREHERVVHTSLDGNNAVCCPFPLLSVVQERTEDGIT